MISGVLNQIEYLDSHTKSGENYESVITDAIASYCEPKNISYKKTTGTDEDKYEGTDLRIQGHLDDLAFNAGVLRLDITHNFSGKRHMPVVWQTTPGLTQRNQQLQFGVRTGNGVTKFDNPVVVIGINAPKEDINATLNFIKSELLSDPKKTERMLYEAGEVLAAYTYMTNPRYRKYIERTATDTMDLPNIHQMTMNKWMEDRYGDEARHEWNKLHAKLSDDSACTETDTAPKRSKTPDKWIQQLNETINILDQDVQSTFQIQ